MKGIDLILKNSDLDFYNDEEKNQEVCLDIKNRLVDSTIKINYYKVKYSYKTQRGHKRENYKYVPCVGDEDAEIKFYEWMKEFNKKYPVRALLNVRILGCGLTGSTKLSLR